MTMHDPPHPGGIVRRQCLEPLGLTVTRAAEGLGVTRQALSELLNGRTGVSVEMAVRLSKAFGSTPETWLGLQMAYDLWQVRSRAGEDCSGALWDSLSGPLFAPTNLDTYRISRLARTRRLRPKILQ